MTKQRSSTSSDKTVFGWVSDVAERVGVDRVGTYFGVERVSSALGEAMQGAARTKARVDRNLEVLFTLANLPSKRDYQSLQTKLDTLQGALMNLNRKLDDLTQDLAAGVSKRAKKNGAARKVSAGSSSSRKSPRKTTGKSTGKSASSSRSSRARARKPKARR